MKQEFNQFGKKIVNKKVVSRFAPSPTGELHIGGARTALFAWLYSKSYKGQCLLRLEDTDKERSEQKYIDSIVGSFEWLGIVFDGKPFYQSKNKNRHLKKARELLANDKAYYCECSSERLNQLREEQQKRGIKPKYDEKCRELNLNETSNSVIRFKNPKDGYVRYKDIVRGEIEVSNGELDDLILVRSDGTPTYNLCVVIDDLDMNITHVIRGDDHINNTFRQINIFEALGEKIPKYGHLPMILGEDNKRMSKRHGAISFSEYREKGIIPEAMLNYLSRLGWSLGDQEIFDFEELVEKFKEGKINSSPASFSMDKLLWFNKQYLSGFKKKDLINKLTEFSSHFKEDDYSLRVLDLIKERCHLLSDYEEEAKYFFEDLGEINSRDENKIFNAEAISVLNALLQEFSELDKWTSESIHNIVEKVMASFNLGMGQVAKPLRLAVTGRTQSPSIDKTCEVLGKDKVLNRLKEVLDRFS